MIIPKLIGFGFKVQRLQPIDTAHNIDQDPEYPTYPIEAGRGLTWGLVVRLSRRHGPECWTGEWGPNTYPAWQR